MDLQRLLDTTLPGLGYELVDLELARNGLMRVFIDKPEGVQPTGITLDDCVAVSNHLTRLFAVENVPYERLEVSSPGLDRPLKKAADFQRFAGGVAKVKLRVPQEGRKVFEGRLEGVVEGRVQLQLDDGSVVELPLAQIDKARLVPQF